VVLPDRAARVHVLAFGVVESTLSGDLAQVRAQENRYAVFMLNKRPIVAFLATNDSERSKQFYMEVLGLELQEESPFALVFDLNGTTLRIQKTRGHVPAPHTALGWESRAIADDVRALLARGVHFERFAGMEQDELAIWSPPGPPGQARAQVAWFKDPDGNLLSLSQ
jgi:catechol 2,3-dioxygenase-like lactoylglutathione lyase family enzyme